MRIIPTSKGRYEEIEGAPGTCPPSNEGGLQGGHWKSSPSLDSTETTPLKSPLGQGGTSQRATSFCKDSRIFSQLPFGRGDFRSWLSNSFLRKLFFKIRKTSIRRIAS